MRPPNLRSENGRRPSSARPAASHVPERHANCCHAGVQASGLRIATYNAEQLDMAFSFTPARKAGNGHFGNAWLSKGPHEAVLCGELNFTARTSEYPLLVESRRRNAEGSL